jgi:hypothetical protein
MKKRIVTALAVCTSVAATFAATASALTAQQKEAKFEACLKSTSQLMKGGPDPYDYCCTQAGGTVYVSQFGKWFCEFKDDRVASDSVLPQSAPAIVVIKP